MGQSLAGKTFRAALPFLPVGLCLFIIQLDFFSVSLALPSIARELHEPVTHLQWLISAYMLVIGALIIPAGRLSDILGRRRTLLCGVALFGLASLACGLSSSPVMLIIFRIIQGVGAATIMPTAYALVTNSTKAAERPAILGLLIGIAGLGTALGPVAGGVLAGTVGWRWVFLLNVPIAAFVLWRGRTLPESRDNDPAHSLARFDWWGVATLAIGLGLFSYGLDNMAQGDGGWPAAALMIAGLLCLAAFIKVELTSAWPLVQPALVKNGPFVFIVAAGLVANSALNIFVFAAPIDLQLLRHVPATTAGLLFMVGAAGLGVCGPISSKLLNRWKAGHILGVCVVLAGLSLFFLAFIQWLPLYVTAMAVCGFTAGMGYTVAQVAIQDVLPPERAAEANSLFLMVLIVLGGIGVVVAGGLIKTLGHGHPTSDSITATLSIYAALTLLVGIPMFIKQFRPAKTGA